MPVAVDSLVGQIPLAIDRLAGRTPVASPARTAQWQRVPLALRDRAFFSAGVEDIAALVKARQLLDEWAALDPAQAFRDRSKFVAAMRQHLGAPQGDSGRLTDIASRRRLELIYHFQTTQAAEYARFIVGSDPAVRDAFPCQELVRLEPRREPRDWLTRWQAAGGRLFGGRMIARKDDPVWTAISAFGTPFPPFDFGSGMGVADVERSEAEALGVITPDEKVTTPAAGFNDHLEQSIANLDDQGRQELRDLFGDHVVITGDKVQWQGNLIGDFYDATRAWDAAGRPPEAKPKEIRLGKATPAAVTLARRAGMEIEGHYLALRPDDIVKTLDTHGVTTELRRDQRPVTRLDLEILPHVWRAPDDIVAGNKPRTLEFIKTILGEPHAIAWQKDPAQPRFFVNTLYIKKEQL